MPPIVGGRLIGDIINGFPPKGAGIWQTFTALVIRGDVTVSSLSHHADLGVQFGRQLDIWQVSILSPLLHGHYSFTLKQDTTITTLPSSIQNQ